MVEVVLIWVLGMWNTLDPTTEYTAYAAPGDRVPQKDDLARVARLPQTGSNLHS